MVVSLYDIAARYIGIKGIAGSSDHPLIQWWLSLCGFGFDAHDEVPWCSAFINGMAWQIDLPRSKSAAARSWLMVGARVPSNSAPVAQVGAIVVLSRGSNQPGPEVINAPGHVGLFHSYEGETVRLLGGNQSDGVSIASFPKSAILGIRQL